MTDRAALRNALERARAVGYHEGYEKALRDERERAEREAGRRRARAASLKRHGLAVPEVARVMGLSEAQVKRMLAET